MAIHTAATSLADDSRSSRVTYQSIVTTAGQISDYCKEGVGIGYTNQSTDTPDFGIEWETKLTEGWVSFYMYCADMTTNNWGHYMWALRDSAMPATPILSLYKVLNSLSYNIINRHGTSQVTTALGGGMSLSLLRFDVYFKLDATVGRIEIYINGTSYFSFTGAFLPTGSDGINYLTFQREGGNSGVKRVISSIIVSDTDTRPMELTMDYATGNGFNTDWNGDYLNIDGTGRDDTTEIYSKNVGDIETFTFPAIDAGLAAYDPVACGVAVSGKISSKQVDVVARLSGVDYILGAVNQPNGKVIGAVLVEDNPDTALPWLQSEINAGEFGVQVAIPT